MIFTKDSWLTEEEILALQSGEMPRLLVGAAFFYRHVSATQLSIARHTMGATVNGQHFLYIPTTDELIREDVVKWIQSRRKKKLKEKQVLSPELQEFFPWLKPSPADSSD